MSTASCHASKDFAVEFYGYLRFGHFDAAWLFAKLLPCILELCLNIRSGSVDVWMQMKCTCLILFLKNLIGTQKNNGPIFVHV